MSATPRSSRERRRRPSGSRNGAPAALRGADAHPGPSRLTALPDTSGRLADGTLVKASILARVLGIRLLTVEATVAVVPAAPADSPRTRSSGALRVRSRAAGPRLAEAARSISEGAALLEGTRCAGVR